MSCRCGGHSANRGQRIATPGSINLVSRHGQTAAVSTLMPILVMPEATQRFMPTGGWTGVLVTVDAADAEVDPVERRDARGAGGLGEPDGLACGYGGAIETHGQCHGHQTRRLRTV